MEGNAGERRCLKRVANLDGISKDLFVQFVDDGCLVIKQARDKLDLVWSILHIK